RFGAVGGAGGSRVGRRRAGAARRARLPPERGRGGLVGRSAATPGDRARPARRAARAAAGRAQREPRPGQRGGARQDVGGAGAGAVGGGGGAPARPRAGGRPGAAPRGRAASRGRGRGPRGGFRVTAPSIYDAADLYDAQYERYRDDVPHYLRLADDA